MLGKVLDFKRFRHMSNYTWFISNFVNFTSRCVLVHKIVWFLTMKYIRPIVDTGASFFKWAASLHQFPRDLIYNSLINRSWVVYHQRCRSLGCKRCKSTFAKTFFIIIARMYILRPLNKVAWSSKSCMRFIFNLNLESKSGKK